MTNLHVEMDNDNKPFIRLSDDVIFQLDEAPLDDEYQQRARLELRETPEIVESALARMREVLEQDKDLYVPLDNTEYLLKFLRPCKFYPESAARLLQRFYKFRAKYPKICKDVFPSTTRAAFDQNIFIFAPKRDKKGRRLLIIKTDRWNPKVCSAYQMFQVCMLAVDATLCEEKTQIAGVVVILDLQGLTFTQVCHISPYFIKMQMEWIQDSLPIRLKAVHIINQSYLFNIIFKMVKPLLKEKYRTRIHFHGSDRAFLDEDIGLESCPTLVGGALNVPEIPGSLLCDLFVHYEDEYRDYAKYGYPKKE